MLTTKQFWLAAGKRAVRTFAQTLVALIGTGAVVGISQVPWATDLGVAGTAAVLSLLTSLAGADPIAEPPASPAPAAGQTPADGA